MRPTVARSWRAASPVRLAPPSTDRKIRRLSVACDARPSAPLRLADDRSRRRAGWRLPFERRSQLAGLPRAEARLGRPGRARGDLLARAEPEARLRQPAQDAVPPAERALGPADRARGTDGARSTMPTDVAEFEAALRDGRVDDALPLYAGDLLAGFDDAGSEAWTQLARLRARPPARRLARRGPATCRPASIDADRGRRPDRPAARGRSARRSRAPPAPAARWRRAARAAARAPGLPGVRRPPSRRPRPRARRRAAGAARQPGRRAPRRRCAAARRRAGRPTTASSAARSSDAASPRCWRRTTAA